MKRKGTQRHPIISLSTRYLDWSRVKDEIASIDTAKTHRFHIDVVDGHFRPMISVGSIPISCFEKVSPLPITIHYLVENPDRIIPSFDQIRAEVMIVHPETSECISETLRLIKKRKHPTKAGIAMSNRRQLSVLKRIVEDVDQILVLAVDPGFSGQTFQPEALELITWIKEFLPDKDLQRIEIAIEGGISTKNMEKIIEAGFDRIILEYPIFKNTI